MAVRQQVLRFVQVRMAEHAPLVSAATFFSVIALGLLLNIAYTRLFWVIDERYNITVWQQIVTWAKIFWLNTLFFALFNCLGFLLYGSPSRRNALTLAEYTGWSPSKLLIIAYVSRGDNWQALERALLETHAALRRMHARYQIEVVTDQPVAQHFAPLDHVHFVVVPPDYAPPNGTRYKARALHYLVQERAARTRTDDDNTWILHLDEESILLDETVAGIHRFITDPANRRVIGQGEIVYNGHQYGRNLLVTACDAIRTGDDLGRFRLQFRLLRRPAFGMHGSYILIPAALEAEIGFDLGAKGSLTEDAYFSLVAAERGVRFGWVDGVVREQSPFTVDDLIRQRVRWLHGLTLIVSDSTLRRRTRFTLAISVWLWRLSWLSNLITVANIVVGGSYFPLPLTLLAVFGGGIFWATYLVGTLRNLETTSEPLRREQRVLVLAAPLVLMPLVNVVESIAILRGIFTTPAGFEIVAKN